MVTLVPVASLARLLITGSPSNDDSVLADDAAGRHTSSPSLRGENPGNDRVQIPIRHIEVRRHGHSAPHTHAALFDLRDEVRGGVRLGAIFRGNIVVRRPNDALFHGMTRHARQNKE